ncbi:actin [Aphomia sociella]
MSQDGIGVVLDAGSQCMKAGFAEEPFPRCVVPTTVGRFRRAGLIDGIPLIYCGREAVRKRGLSHLTWPVKKGLIQDWDEMEKLWHHVFYKELHVPPEECMILHSVHPLMERKDKEKMTEILFESFATKSLYLAKSPALVLHASGKTSGVVWKNGYSCSYAAPVFEGFPLRHSTITSELTGEALTDRLQKLMAKNGYSFTTLFERDILNRIKAELCYVCQDYATEMTKSSSQDKIHFDLPDGQRILLGEERFQCPEILFQPSLDSLNCRNVVEMVCDSINCCDEDYKTLFYNNIVVSGGSSIFSGFSERLKAELILKTKKLPEVKVNVDGISNRQFATWIGGSLLASLGSMKGFWLTSEEYVDAGSDRVNYKFF